MKQIFLDTETTGFVAEHGDRIIEVAAIAFGGGKPAGVFHSYFNPECEVSFGSFAVHNKSREDLEDEPLFADKAKELAAFLSGAEVIMHNAAFDSAFLDAEFKRAGMNTPLSDIAYCTVCSLQLARKLHPHLESHKLDSLLLEFGVIEEYKRRHGALSDAELLAKLYFHPRFNPA